MGLKIIEKSTLQHLRIPFSFFLMPVYFFALATSQAPSLINAFIIFIVLHLFAYPASNGYNSYFDKDEGSIGGLKNPPKVTKNLYYVSLLTDFVGNLLAFVVSWQFAIMIFVYGLASKSYSHPSVRLKSKPYLGWLVAGFFQGFFTFWMCYLGMNGKGFSIINEQEVWLPALLSSIMLWGSYPMTQVYQHKEDEERGDITISIKLGIIGTFRFTMFLFGAASIGMLAFFYLNKGVNWAILFQLCMTPVLAYFFSWYFAVIKDRSKADFSRTMKLNLISSACLNFFFIMASIW